MQVAIKWLQARSYDKQRVRLLGKFILATFKAWKLESGFAPRRLSELGKGMASLLSATRLEISDEERFERIKYLVPWECLPHWINRKNPIELWNYIIFSDHEKGLQDYILDGLAYLIIVCHHNQKRRCLFLSNCSESIIVNASWIQSILLEQKEKLINYYRPLANGKIKQHIFIDTYNVQRKIGAKFKEKQVCDLATKFLGNGIQKKDIASLITKSLHSKLLPSTTEFKNKKRDILRKLSSHSSGYWSKNKK